MADGSGELTMIVVHASTALRRKRDTLASLHRDVSSVDPEALERAVGEASQAAVAFYLAVAAAHRYCAANDEPGPLGRTQLAEVRAIAGNLRDAILHWDDKSEREAESSLHVDGRGLVIYAPPGRKPGAVPLADGFTWKEFERIASGLERWARFMRDEGRS